MIVLRANLVAKTELLITIRNYNAIRFMHARVLWYPNGCMMEGDGEFTSHVVISPGPLSFYLMNRGDHGW